MSDLFGTDLRARRTAHGWSLRDLAERITYNRAYIGKVEQGEKFPDRQFAALADDALSAAGHLVALWQAQREERQVSARTAKLLSASVADSLLFIDTIEEGDSVDELHQAAARLSVDYLATPASAALLNAVEVRGEVLRRLRNHDFRPHQLKDLYMTLARVQGVLSYTALDLGDAAAASTHSGSSHLRWGAVVDHGVSGLRPPATRSIRRR